LELDILWVFGGATIYDAFLVDPQFSQLIDGFIITTAPERPCDERQWQQDEARQRRGTD
jgi:hypothetical protein